MKLTDGAMQLASIPRVADGRAARFVEVGITVALFAAFLFLLSAVLAQL